MKRVLVCGSNGLLGQHVAHRLGNRTDLEVLNTGRQRSFAYDHLLFDYTELDLSNRSDVRSLLSSFLPDVIINTVAAINVDWCEEHRDGAWKANVSTVEHLIEGARKKGSHIIHVSTDYVFDGKNGPYAEDHRPAPINYYGKTKLAAENLLLSAGLPVSIARVSLLFGAGIAIKPNFVSKVVQSLRSGKTVYATKDIGTNPTLASDAAHALVTMMERQCEGIFHISGPDAVHRLEYAHLIAKTFNLPAEGIQEVSASDLDLPAERPRWTSFSIEKARQELSFAPLSVRDAIEKYKRDLSHTVMN
jgi:dTDP-4-dehydrorhamnose reductase